MTQDDMMDLIVGAAVVVLGYALYSHHKAQKAAANSAPPLNVPAPPEVWEEGGIFYFDLNRILQGAV